jgi:hypothetical protein
MKGKIFGTLFALPFAAVGVWMGWSIGSTLHDAWQMRDWVQVEAELLAGGYETRSGDESDTYEAYAEYRYHYAGRVYKGDRVSTASGADNIGDYQQDIGRHLGAAHSRGERIRVYVDPGHPSQSIIDRGVRWGLVGFKLVFVIVFGGLGFGLLIYVWCAPGEKDKSDPVYSDKPWLLNEDWQSATVRSGSRKAMWFAWGFAVFWNAISSFAPFAAWREINENGNYIVLIALLFPLVGIGLLVWAIRQTLEWRRFGPAPVILDPFPGSIGGHVGGTIDLNLPYDPGSRFKLTLTNVHSYESGDSQNEKAKWQDSIVAHAEPGGKGTRLSFRFDVPDGLHESDVEQGKDYFIWRLHLQAELPGTDLDRNYELPVYATAQQSRFLATRSIERARSQQSSIDAEAVKQVVNLSYGSTGKRMYFPMGRYLSNTIAGAIVGAIFVAVGWFLIAREDATIFGSVFGGIGALIAVLCLYMLFNSLEVQQTGSGIQVTRRLLGIPISRKTVNADQIVALEKDSSFQTQSGGKHVIYYKVLAVDRSGGRHVLGEGFRGESEARAAIELIRREFGIRIHAEPAPTGGEEHLLGPEALS